MTPQSWDPASSPRNVSYMPPADLKSGIPDATLTPAPVNKGTEEHFGDDRKFAISFPLDIII